MGDVILDEGDQVTIRCSNVNVQGHDLLLDYPGRRKANGPRFRRALVHDSTDGLSLNFEGDYPGGLRLNGVTELLPLQRDLVVRGGISYEAQGIDLAGHPTAVTVVVDQELSALHAQIAKLTARVEALEARP